MKQLKADEQGHVEGLEALFPPGAIVYIDEAGHYAGHASSNQETETSPSSTEQLQEPPA